MRAHLEPKPDCLVRVERSKELILELGISVGDSCQASGYSINSKGQNGIENLGITYVLKDITNYRQPTAYKRALNMGFCW